MATPYSTTFTMVALGTTITFNVRPTSIRYNNQAMIARGGIPGSNQSFVQHMGQGGLEVEFQCDAWNITSITMTGAPVNAEDLVVQWRAWYLAGTTIAVTTDHILEINGNAAMSMKIVDLGVVEEAGIQHSYIIRFILQEFKPGLAL